MTTLIQKEGLRVKGVHIFTKCRAVSDKAKELERQIENVRIKRSMLIEAGLATRAALDALHEEYTFFVKILHRFFKTEEKVVENITTTVGRSVLAARLGGDTTYTGIVNYTALGDDNSAAAVGDTALGNEVYRKALSSGTDLNNVAYLETFFTAAEVTGDFEEYGNFIDGNGAADSGQMFNRFTEAVSKSALETLNVQSIITINDA